MDKTTVTAAVTTLLVGGMLGILSPSDFKSIDEIAAAEDMYFAKNGSYFQVLEGNKKAPYEKGTVNANLGGTMPTTIRVTVYDNPREGKGYQIIVRDGKSLFSVGYGPEAESRTWQQISFATST